MKIMRVKDKKIGDTQYIKYRINLPKKIVEEGKFLDKELKVELEGEKIVIEKDDGFIMKKTKDNKTII